MWKVTDNSQLTQCLALYCKLTDKVQSNRIQCSKTLKFNPIENVQEFSASQDVNNLLETMTGKQLDLDTLMMNFKRQSEMVGTVWLSFMRDWVHCFDQHKLSVSRPQHTTFSQGY